MTDYHLGTDDRELERLGYQHQAWLDVSVALWNEAGFGLGQEILDLGCGPGYATLDLAHRVGHRGLVHAVDASDRFVAFLEGQIRAAGLRQVRPLAADVHDLDLPDASVDGAFARWLLCFVKDPAQVVAEVARVLRVGGRFVALDYFNYLAVNIFPRRPSITALFDAYHRSALRNHGSYDIGERLPELLHACGMEVTTLEPVCRIARPGSTLWRWLALFNDSYAPKLVEQGLLTQEQHAALVHDFAELSESETAFFFTPPILGVVAVKRG